MTQSCGSYVVIKYMLRHILGGSYNGGCAARRGQVTLYEISDLFMPICHSNLWKQTAQWWVCGCVGGVFAETERGAKYSAFKGYPTAL